jgi:hypothetical protein
MTAAWDGAQPIPEPLSNISVNKVLHLTRKRLTEFDSNFIEWSQHRLNRGS